MAQEAESNTESVVKEHDGVSAIRITPPVVATISNGQQPVAFAAKRHAVELSAASGGRGAGKGREQWLEYCP